LAKELIKKVCSPKADKSKPKNALRKHKF